MHRGIPQKCYAAMEKKPEINPESPHPHTNSSRISRTGAPEIKLGTATAMQSDYVMSTKKNYQLHGKTEKTTYLRRVKDKHSILYDTPKDEKVLQ